MAAIAASLAGLWMCAAVAASSENSLPYLAAVRPHPLPIWQESAQDRTFVAIGIASWYGNWHRGRITANGERYDPQAFTAAHRSLPFGTVIRVTNLETGGIVRVRINDRGPYVGGRALDLSAAAARALGITREGTKRVRMEAFASDQRPDLVTSELSGPAQER